MPRESIDQVRRLLEEVDQRVRMRPATPEIRRRRKLDRNPPALASTFIERRAVQTMHYVFTRRFDLQMGGDFLVTLPCAWGDHQEPTETLFSDPAHDTRIFWFRKRPPDSPFAVTREQVQVSDPNLGFVTIGKVIDHDLANELWPSNGPLREFGGKQ